jgi:hypothetical protein
MRRIFTTSLIWVIGIAVAGLLLYFALRGTDLHQLLQTIAGARPGLVGVSCALTTVTLALRAARWRLLLNAEGRVPYATTFWASAAGYFGNNFLPARAGELVRTFLITSASGLDAAYVLATALSERVIDAVVLVLIASVVLTMFPAQSGWLVGAARSFGILALAGAIVLIVVPFTTALTQHAIGLAPRRLRPLAERAFDSASRGLRALHDARRLSAFLAFTAVIWTLDAFAVIAVGSALGLRVTLPIGLLLLSAMGLASALPSTPGYVGVFQFVAVMVLTPFGFTRADAIGLVVVLQVASYAVNAFWGTIGVARYRRAARGLGNAARDFVR